VKLGLGLHRGLALRLDYLLLGLLALLLAAWGGDEGDDLDQYMQDATKNIKPKVQPLPEVNPYVALIYN
jgi:type IV pilus assembly protein PilP